MKVVLAGGTGLIGGELVKILVNSGHEFHIIGRRLVCDLPDNVHQHIAPSDTWPDLVTQIGADVAVSCLGTTMKDAGSRQAFAAVDLELVTAFAAAAKAGGAGQFIGVSSVGADSKAANFYLRTKGAAEDVIAGLGYDRIDFMRPGLLRGDRQGPPRFGETLGVLISPLTDMMMFGAFSRYRSISAQTVARAMAALIGVRDKGRVIHENNDISALAG